MARWKSCFGMKPEAFIRNLGKGTVPALIVCTGEEYFFKEEVLCAVRSTIEADCPDLQTIFWETLPGEKETAETNRLLSEMQTPGLFSPKKLIVAREAKQLLKGGAKALAGLLDAAPSGNTLCFFTDKIDGRTTLSRRLKKEGALVECRRLYAEQAFFQETSRGSGLSQLASWALARARAEDLRLDPEAAGFLVTLTGNNLFVIASEIEKLKLSALGDQPITVSDIEASTGMSALHTPFELWDQMEGGRITDALATLKVILRNGLRSRDGKLVTDAAGIAAILLAFFRSRIRLAASVHVLRHESKSDKEIQGAIGVGSPFYFKQIQRFAGTLTASKYLDLHNTVLSAERRIKRFGLDGRTVLEETVLMIARANKVRK